MRYDGIETEGLATLVSCTILCQYLQAPTGVSLFDRLHARTVLAKFGKAFGRLPDNLGNLAYQMTYALVRGKVLDKYGFDNSLLFAPIGTRGKS